MEQIILTKATNYRGEEKNQYYKLNQGYNKYVDHAHIINPIIDGEGFKFNIMYFLENLFKDNGDGVCNIFVFLNRWIPELHNRVNDLHSSMFEVLFGFKYVDFINIYTKYFKSKYPNKMHIIFLKMYEFGDTKNFITHRGYNQSTDSLIRKTDIHLKLIQLFNYSYLEKEWLSHFRIRVRQPDILNDKIHKYGKCYTIPDFKVDTCKKCSKSIIEYKRINRYGYCHKCRKAQKQRSKQCIIVDQLCGKNGPLHLYIGFELKSFL